MKIDKSREQKGEKKKKKILQQLSTRWKQSQNQF